MNLRDQKVRLGLVGAVNFKQECHHIAVATSDGAEASQEALAESAFEPLSLS
jgi:hypothetical protein